MEKRFQPKPAARALLTFNDFGELQDVFLIALNPHEEALAKKGVQNALKPTWLTKVSNWVRDLP